MRLSFLPLQPGLQMGWHRTCRPARSRAAHRLGCWWPRVEGLLVQMVLEDRVDALECGCSQRDRPMASACLSILTVRLGKPEDGGAGPECLLRMRTRGVDTVHERSGGRSNLVGPREQALAGRASLHLVRRGACAPGSWSGHPSRVSERGLRPAYPCGTPWPSRSSLARRAACRSVDAEHCSDVCRS